VTAIGVCGGTFDPFHRGHREPILAIGAEFGWERVIYIPAWRQPFKLDRGAASPFDRFAMTVLATERDEWCEVSPVELEREAISYTVDTLEELDTNFPRSGIDWIIGDDNLIDLMKWKNIDRIFELANFVVLSRGEALVPAPLRSRMRSAADRGRAGSIVLAHNPTVPISATEIRARIERGESIDSLVDPRVAHYIQKQRLYRPEAL